MNTQKLLICTLVVGVFWFLLDYLFYAVIMTEYFTAAAIDRETPLFPILIGGILIFSFFFCYIYPKGVVGDNATMEGFRYGAMIGLWVFLSMSLVMYATQDRAPFSEYLVDVVYSVVRTGIAGIILAHLSGLHGGDRGGGKKNRDGDE